MLSGPTTTESTLHAILGTFCQSKRYKLLTAAGVAVAAAYCSRLAFILCEPVALTQ